MHPDKRKAPAATHGPIVGAAGAFVVSFIVVHRIDAAHGARRRGHGRDLVVIEGEETCQVVHGEAAQDAFFGGDDGVGEGLLLLLELEDLLLDGVLGDEADDVHALLLADAVRAVGGLVLDALVPPRVVMDDGVGAGEVETDAASFQGDEKDGNLLFIETVDQRHALAGLGLASEGDVGDATFLQLWRDHVEDARELAEDEHLMAAGGALLDHRETEGELGRGLVETVKEEGRRTADLAQAHEQRQHAHARLGQRVPGDLFDEGFVAEGELGVVDASLFLAELGIEDGVDLVRELGENVVLHAAQDERRDLALELLEAGSVFVARDRDLIEMAELAPAVQVARQAEIHDAPEIGQGIFDRGAGEGKMVQPGKALEAAGYKERTVNDMLRRFASSDRLKSMIRAGNINIFGLTHRCAIRTAITSVTRENIISSLIDIDSLFVSSFFDKSKPIAVSSLNPLLPGNGWTGPDEDGAIIPAIEIVRKLGINAVGPIAPEFLFERAAEGEFSAILVMAATEGLAAASAAAPGGAFFLTWGLPFIRVGTISDIGLENAGKGIARIDKFVASVHAGLDLREADALA